MRVYYGLDFSLWQVEQAEVSGTELYLAAPRKRLEEVLRGAARYMYVAAPRERLEAAIWSAVPGCTKREVGGGNMECCTILVFHTVSVHISTLTIGG